MSEKKQEVRTLVVCVGVGGVFYHGLSMMSNFIQKRENVGVLLIDPDVVEEKNRLRQWGLGVGELKVSVANKILSPLTSGCLIDPFAMPIEKPEDLKEIVLSFADSVGKSEDYAMAVENILVVHSPDNHLCRVLTHEGCGLLSLLVKKPVFEITGGNTVNSGYAYGSRHEGDKIVGDFLTRHPDIKLSADKEIAELESPEPCGSLAEVTEQTGHSNSLTANCIWSLAEKMFRDGMTGEVMWSTDEDKRVWIQERSVV